MDRTGRLRSELWLPYGFDPKLFVTALDLAFPGSKVIGVVLDVECRDHQTNVQYEIPLDRESDLEAFLGRFAAAHNFTHNREQSSFCAAMDTWHEAWYMPTDDRVH